MEIEFDPAKDLSNRQKHGLSLALAGVVLRHRLGEINDPRHGMELRMIAFELLAGRLCVLVYTRRGEVFRVISLRKANGKEQARWLRE